MYRRRKEKLIEKYMDSASSVSVAAGSRGTGAPANGAVLDPGLRAPGEQDKRASEPGPFVCPICVDDERTETFALVCAHRFCTGSELEQAANIELTSSDVYKPYRRDGGPEAVTRLSATLDVLLGKTEHQARRRRARVLCPSRPRPFPGAPRASSCADAPRSPVQETTLADLFHLPYGAVLKRRGIDLLESGKAPERDALVGGRSQLAPIVEEGHEGPLSTAFARKKPLAS
ncbi:uncharacterized protein BXZ73DRAFT_105543 [Epithele typhae]|uniref:uncharacterized protein n=1 Tax=Epithele typhae TaxID=378194 RepID=UPI002008E364|nr:uncharacterized protein BXZ73DRAFT_105543 [Epithele typhae]KAH9917381.1 hypothetical protein BXZ73DRAFT_105543 [Epithele typhae]